MRMGNVVKLVVLTTSALITACSSSLSSHSVGLIAAEASDNSGDSDTQTFIQQATRPADVPNGSGTIPGSIYDGEVSEPGVEKSSPGSSGEDASAGEPGAEGVGPVSIEAVRNDEFGYTIDVPTTWSMSAADAQIKPMPVAQYEWRQDTSSNLGPPQLSIRVYEEIGSQSLDAWVAETGASARYGQDASLMPFSLNGMEAIRVTSTRFIAPNQAVFVVAGGRVFELTPVGSLAEEAIATFRFE